MRKMVRKLRSQRGETLVEVLASVLVASLSVALLMGSVAASANLGKLADNMDEEFYQTLSAAESRSDAVASGTVQVQKGHVTGGETVASIPVQIYGGEGLYSYALAPTDAAGGAGT